MQKLNPIFTGLITPPESPVRCVLPESPASIIAQSPRSFASEANSDVGSANGTQKAMEALCSAIRIANADKVAQHDVFYNHVPDSDASATPTTSVDLGDISENIYSIVENAVEEKMAAAMGPLRMNINRLDDLKSLESDLRREHADIRDQNDTMSRQLDLHYRTIEQNAEEFQSQSKAMNTMIGAQADNLAATINMVSHLSQVVTNLPMAINQVIHNAVQQQTQLAIRDIMFAQQQAMFSISDLSETRQSISSDGISSQCACSHHGLEIESMASTQHSRGLTEPTALQTSPKSSRGFRSKLRKLFKSNK